MKLDQIKNTGDYIALVEIDSEVSDEADGQLVTITDELRARALSTHDAIHSGIRAMLEGSIVLMRALSITKAERTYLALGYTSYKDYMSVMGLSYDYANKLALWGERYPDEVLALGPGKLDKLPEDAKREFAEVGSWGEISLEEAKHMTRREVETAVKAERRKANEQEDVIKSLESEIAQIRDDYARILDEGDDARVDALKQQLANKEAEKADILATYQDKIVRAMSREEQRKIVYKAESRIVEGIEELWQILDRSTDDDITDLAIEAAQNIRNRLELRGLMVE